MTYTADDLVLVRRWDLARVDKAENALALLVFSFSTLQLLDIRVDPVNDGLGTSEPEHGRAATTTAAAELRERVGHRGQGEKLQPDHRVYLLAVDMLGFL